MAIADPDVMKDAHRRARLGVAYRMGLHKSVPALMKQRGWPWQNDDLVAVLAAAVALKAQGAGGQMLRRPAAADGLGGLWPAASLAATAKQICDTLELDDLLQPL